MACVDGFAPTLLERAAALVWQMAQSVTTRATASGTHDKTRDRHLLVQEMLDRNPDALSTDRDVQMMMQKYPGSF